MVDCASPDPSGAVALSDSWRGEIDRAADQSSVEIALLDRHGVIVSVNRAWQDFCRANGGDPAKTGVGASYLDASATTDDPSAREVGRAIQIAVRGDLPAPMAVRIPCDAPDVSRLFDVLVSSRLGDDGSCLGATVTLSPVELVPNRVARPAGPGSGISIPVQAGGGSEPDGSEPGLIGEAQRAARVGEDREHLAADLNDQVIRELFAIGLGLQGMLDRLSPGDQRDRVEGYIQSLDTAIARLRAIIFPAERLGCGTDGLKQRLLRVLDEQRALGRLEVKIDFSGPLEALAGLDDDVVAFVREAVADVVAHPEATNAHVRVSYDPPVLAAAVTGDAPGVPPEVAGRWRELGLRAEELGGQLEVITPQGGGAGLRWTARAPQRSGALRPE